MIDILRLKDWDDDKLNLTFEESDQKYLEEKAGRLHTSVESINEYIKVGHYEINTLLTGNDKEQNFKLEVKIRYYDEKSEHECKENTHRQEINI